LALLVRNPSPASKASNPENDKIDTPNNRAFITSDRIEAFQLTNAFAVNKFVAIYAQHMNQTHFIDLHGIAAGVPVNVYIWMIIICFLLIVLFAFIEFVRPSEKLNYFNILSVILPCFNSQA
jgi:glucose-6-phosphate-specific signal transduction histidine kinase